MPRMGRKSSRNMRVQDANTRTAPTEIPDWYDHAACIGMNDLFFPESLSQGRPRNDASDEAIAICHVCPVIGDCAHYALTQSNAQDPYGIWGGMTARQRKNMRRRRRAA
jgi:WhiB family redox-sensing transcriptional regulator